jgi:hypothetical protein
MQKIDRIMYRLGLCGILLASFCWGWNMDHFKKEKN